MPYWMHRMYKRLVHYWLSLHSQQFMEYLEWKLSNRCDVCKRPCWYVVSDVVDETIDGDMWEHFVPIGVLRRGCLNHPVKPKTYLPFNVPSCAPYWTLRDWDKLSAVISGQPRPDCVLVDAPR